MTDPRRSPNAKVLKKGEPLNVDPDWRITPDVQKDLDAMTPAEREFIPAAKALAVQMGETCPDAWIWYIGWACLKAR